MRTRMMIEKPADVVLTLKIEATADEFGQLRNELVRLRNSHTANPIATQFEGELCDLLSRVRRVLYPDTPYPKLCARFFDVPFYVESDAPDHVLDKIFKRLGAEPKALQDVPPRRPDGTLVGDGGPMER